MILFLACLAGVLFSFVAYRVNFVRGAPFDERYLVAAFVFTLSWAAMAAVIWVGK